jgi:ribosome biogenesis ATPase
MPSTNGKHRASLSSGLDKEVFQIVRKFQDDQANITEGGGSGLPSVSAVYRYIQASNSTLKRKPKQLLEKSIDRVVAVLMDDEEGSDENDIGPMDIDVDDLTGNQNIPNRSANFMNKSIIGAWQPPSGEFDTSNLRCALDFMLM